MRRPVTRSLLIPLSKLYEYYVRLEWRACEREAHLDGLPREDLERCVWEASQLRRMAATFFGCFGALAKDCGECDSPDRVHPSEQGSAFFSSYLVQQAGYWSGRATEGDAGAREAAVRLPLLEDASASFHRLLGHPPEVVRDRAGELEIELGTWWGGMRWDPKHGFEMDRPEGPAVPGDRQLLARLDPPAPIQTTTGRVQPDPKGGA